MRWLAASLVALAVAAPLPAQSITARVEGVSGSAAVRVLAPPADDVGGDSLPSPVLAMAPLAVPRDTSPHFDFIRRTFTDFCYCWDGAAGLQARSRAALTMYDLEMSGDLNAWLAANPKIITLRYVLMASTFDERTKDKPSLNGVFLEDMRSWYAQHPEYDFESAWIHTAGGPPDSAHRVNPKIWNDTRYIGNPADSGWRAYTRDRFWRLAANAPGGLFIDEMDPPNLGKIGNSYEFPAGDTTWMDAVVDQVRELRELIAPQMLQINPAGYSDRDFAKRLGVAAGSVHLELNLLATQEQPSKWSLIDWYLGQGVYVDFVAAEQWTDMLRDSWLVKYPGGNYASPVLRTKVSQLASYYMVVDSGAKRVGLQIDNTRAPVTPDSVDLEIYRFDVGAPTGTRRMVLDVRDALSQRARVYRRDFTHAVVLYRPVAYWADTRMDDSTAVSVPLPEGGPWYLVTASGRLRPIDSLALRNGEAAILTRRP